MKLCLQRPAVIQQYLTNISTYLIDVMSVLDDIEINTGWKKKSNFPAYSQVQTAVNHYLQYPILI